MRNCLAQCMNWSGSRANSGGARDNSEGKRKNAGSARINDGGKRVNAGGTREDSGGKRVNAGGHVKIVEEVGKMQVIRKIKMVSVNEIILIVMDYNYFMPEEQLDKRISVSELETTSLPENKEYYRNFQQDGRL